MPPLPKILTPALVEMVDELRFASREALVRTSGICSVGMTTGPSGSFAEL